MDDTNAVPESSISPARTRRLKSVKPNGKAYKRWADVEAEIKRVLALHESEWFGEAPDLQNETLVFLIRHVRYGNQELYGRLLQEVSRRVLGQATHSIYGLDETAREYVVLQVEFDILKLVLTDKPTRRSDYLEIAFAKAVKRLTVDYVRKHKSSPMGHRDEFAPNTAEHDTDETEDPIKLVADHRPGPQAIFLLNDEEAGRGKKVKEAYSAVKDPVDREVVRLHIEEGLPIHSSDPNKEDVVRRVGETVRRVKYRFSRAMKAMRKAFGV